MCGSMSNLLNYVPLYKLRKNRIEITNNVNEFVILVKTRV